MRGTTDSYCEESPHSTAVWNRVGQGRDAVFSRAVRDRRQGRLSGNGQAGDEDVSKVSNERQDGLRLDVLGSGRTVQLGPQWKLRAIRDRLVIASGGG